MIDLKLNKKRLAMHWHYYAWKYFVFIALALVAANFLFSATTPKAPPEKRVDIIIISGSATNTDTDEWGRDILRLLPPDQMEANVTTTPIYQGQESTIYQLIAARMSAGEGNIWIMPKDMFQSYATSGAFRFLDDDIKSFNVPEGTDLSGGMVNVQEDENTPGEKHLCGIPLDKCTGLTEMFLPTDMVLAFPAYATMNVDNAAVVANWLLEKTHTPQLLSNLTPKDYVSIPVIAGSFRAANTDAWQAELVKSLGSGIQAASVPLKPMHEGREAFTANQIAAEIKKGKGYAWIVPQSVFKQLAEAGVLRALDDDIASFRVPEGTDLTLGQAAVVQNGKAGDSHQYGIPLDQSASLGKVAAPEGMVLVFPSWRGGDFQYDAAKRAANWLITTDLAPEKAPEAAK